MYFQSPDTIPVAAELLLPLDPCRGHVKPFRPGLALAENAGKTRGKNAFRIRK